jgi:hypothetical protein
MTETMTGNDDVELPLVKAVLAATSLLESHREKVTSCTSLLEMAGHRGRVGMIWAFTAGFIVSAVLMAILVFNPLKRDAEEWRSLALQWHAIADLRSNRVDQKPPSDGAIPSISESSH